MRRLGCLTPLGLLVAFVALVVVVGVTVVKGGVLFSPGPLNAQTGEPKGGVRSHAEIQECGRCHAPFWSVDTMADRCMDCHTQVRDEILNSQGLHGRLVKDQGRLSCRTCHTEHRGPQAALTILDPATFPHEVVGFSLQAHQAWPSGQPFVCTDCHVQRLTAFEPGTCVECHRDLDAAFVRDHQRAFGEDCLACHDGVDRFSDFVHNRDTGFPLEGAHARAACADCHQGDTTLVALQETPNTCFDCHQQDDVHRGRFGPRCEVCHQPRAWEPVTFDHARTNFPLEGQHARVSCEACHGENFTVLQPASTCYDCHAQDDPHEGQFGTRCESCHVATAWDEVFFDHAETDFPLTGKHREVACQACHTTGDFTVALDTACVACHQDPDYHRGLFGTTCEDCHTTEGWRPARYDEPHRFPINHGARAGGNTCQTCHPNVLTEYTCYTCHNPTSVAREHREEGITNFQNCVKCHPTGREEEGYEGDDD